ncbi:Uncharacterized protein FKW44_016165, partial [Caligus rogercresseyi]
HWLNDIEYNENIDLKVLRGAANKFDASLDDWFEERLPKDPHGYKILHPLLHSLSHKIEQATRLHVLGRWSSSGYQVTSYGLGGLCEIHTDPYGLFSGNTIPDNRVSLFRSGDMMLTLMGWLEDVDLGAPRFLYILDARPLYGPPRDLQRLVQST